MWEKRYIYVENGLSILETAKFVRNDDDMWQMAKIYGNGLNI